jgi:NDP-sugar pyrophosphorylase family protein
MLGDGFMVLYGDSYLECDYKAIEEAFLASGKLGLMTLFRNINRWDCSNVLYRNGRIERYDKRHPTPYMEHIDYGLGALRAKAFDSYPPGAAIDLADIYRDLINKGQLAGFEVTERFYEIGSPEGLEETRQYLATKSPESRL